jgi:3-oxoacyl-[acyl-carrier protein] reductase
MDLGLSNRTALVFGAAGGLGGAIANTLAAEGVRLALADIDQIGLARTASAIEAAGGTALKLYWDLSERGEIEGHFEAVERELGPVDILVNNTGGPPPSSVSGVNADVWLRQFEAMVLSVIRITDRALPQMRANKWGRVVTSASSGVIAPIANLGLSNALRSTLVGWSKTLAREVASSGITVNLVVPGRIGTARIRSLDEAKAKREGRPVAEVTAESVAAIPAGRFGTPEEYADAVAFLASQRASYVTGSMLRVDGGYIQSI